MADPITTERLTLRRCRPSDAPDFIALELDPRVMRFLNGGAVDHRITDPDTAPFLMPRGAEPYVWTALRRHNREFVGWFSLATVGDGRAELGFRLRSLFWGNGYATEGAKALVDWAFESGRFSTITATTMAVNAASRRVMEKLGMQHVRTEFLEFENPIPGTEFGELVHELRRAPP